MRSAIGAETALKRVLLKYSPPLRAPPLLRIRAGGSEIKPCRKTDPGRLATCAWNPQNGKEMKQMIWICPNCDEVWDINDFDEDWITDGCPACGRANKLLAPMEKL